MRSYSSSCQYSWLVNDGNVWYGYAYSYTHSIHPTINLHIWRLKIFIWKHFTFIYFRIVGEQITKLWGLNFPIPVKYIKNKILLYFFEDSFFLSFFVFCFLAFFLYFETCQCPSPNIALLFCWTKSRLTSFGDGCLKIPLW